MDSIKNEKLIEGIMDLTIIDVYKKHLNLTEIKDKNKETFIKDSQSLHELLSTPKDSNFEQYPPYKEVEKSLFFANDKKKIQILYEIISKIEKDRCKIIEENKLLRKIYFDYKNGFSYPLENYKTEIIEQVLTDLDRQIMENKSDYGEDYIKNAKKLLAVKKAIHIRNNKENYQMSSGDKDRFCKFKLYRILESIATLIKQIELERYCIEKLNELNGGNETENNNQKLKWNGTPGEFGAIFDKLFVTGFIEVIKNKKNMVRLLHSLFEIKNAKGEIVTSDYLYKCFEDKKRDWPHNEFRIPETINYHNDK